MLVSSIRNKTYYQPNPVEVFTKESYAGYIHKQIDWYKFSAEKAVQLARLFDPITGVISLEDGNRIDVLVRGISHRQQGSGGKPPGTFFIARHAQSGDKKMVVVCNDHTTVWIEQVKVAGKSWISGVDFVSSSPDRFWGGGKFVPWRKEFEDHDPNEFKF
jgi:methionyl-tRNA formyltransferase